MNLEVFEGLYSKVLSWKCLVARVESVRSLNCLSAFVSSFEYECPGGFGSGLFSVCEVPKFLVSVLQGLSFRCFEACIQGMRSLNSARCVFQSLSLRCLGDCIHGVSSLNSLRVCSLNVQFEVFGGLRSGSEISEVFEGLFPTVRVYCF